MEYRLGSNALVYAPGFIRYLQVAVQTRKRWAFKVAREGWNLPTKAVHALLIDGTYKVEGDVVVLTVGGKNA